MIKTMQPSSQQSPPFMSCFIYKSFFNAGRQPAKAPQLPENLENILKKFEKVFSSPSFYNKTFCFQSIYKPFDPLSRLYEAPTC